MSALPPKADIAEREWYVRFVPKADIGSSRLKILPSPLLGTRRCCGSSVSGRSLQQKFGEAVRHIDHHEMPARHLMTMP